MATLVFIACSRLMCRYFFGTVNEAKLRDHEREAGMLNWLLDMDIVASMLLRALP